MSMRYPAGFIRPGYDPLKNPDAPTGVSASGDDESASVSFTPPSIVGGSAVSAYYAVSNPGQITGTSASSPVSVTGLTNGESYTFTVWALNTYGPGPYSAASGSANPFAPRGVFANYSSMRYITIATTGNATNFGNLLSTVNYIAGCSSATRSVFGSGENSGDSNVLQYITIATTSNATDFGDLTTKRYMSCGISNDTRGLFAGGLINNGSTFTSNIEYITIASTGNAANFGGLADNYGYSSRAAVGAVASPTRGVFGGGTTGGATQLDRTEYATFATTGNTTAFGGLSQARAYLSGASSNTRGVFAGGYNYSIGSLNTMDYITIATTGNATDFGDLSSTRHEVGGTSDPTRGVFSSTGSTAGGTTYITIASLGNSTTFGTLSVSGSGIAGTSSAHGGLA